ncbi:hypothetical protein B296_00048263, partial [Ensete ventricosum]
ALALLHPHCAVVVAATLATDAATLAGGNPLWAGHWRPPLRAGRNRPCPRVAAPCGLLPLRAVAPLQAAWSQSAALEGSQAMVDRPCREPGRGQTPLHADNMHVAAPPPQAAPTFTTNRCNKRVE